MITPADAEEEIMQQERQMASFIDIDDSAEEIKYSPEKKNRKVKKGTLMQDEVQSLNIDDLLNYIQP